MSAIPGDIQRTRDEADCLYTGEEVARACDQMARAVDAQLRGTNPLLLVTMASQNIPGVAVIRTSGYQTPVSPLISCTALSTLLLAPWGAFSINLAAITAAICTGPEAHPDKDKRYIAGIAAGVFYLLAGLAGATVVALFAALPKEMIAALAGLALLGTIANGLATSLAEARTREAAIVTFLVTLSGVTLLGVGSAFWGLVAGGLTLFVEHYRTRSPAEDTP